MSVRCLWTDMSGWKFRSCQYIRPVRVDMCTHAILAYGVHSYRSDIALVDDEEEALHATTPSMMPLRTL